MVAATKKASQGFRGNLPRGKKVSAGGAAVTGVALAVMTLTMLDAQVEQEERQKADRKNHLRELCKLDAAEQKLYRGGLNERREQIKSAAKSAGQEKLSDYFEMNPKSYQVYVRIAEWGALSEALEKGWSPDFTMGWVAIVNESRKVKDNSTATADPSLVAQLHAVRNDPKLSDEQREAIEKPLIEQINTVLVPKEPESTTTSTGGAQNQSASGADKNQSLWDMVLPLVKDRPIHEVEKLAAQLIVHTAEKQKRQITIQFEYIEKEYVTKAQEATKTAAKTGAAGTEKQHEQKEEKAEARGTRRTAKKSRK